jgi:glycosyltransferase involved in cell wall biosynthesis
MSSLDTATVTVAIPTYNRSGLLARCLESVLAQEGFGPASGRMAVLVHDNASPDDTAAVVAGFHDPRIHYRNTGENLGFFRNWSRALAVVRSPYVAFLQDDDLWHPGFLAATVAALDDHDRASAAFTDVELIDEDDVAFASRSSGLVDGAFPGLDYLEAVVRGDNAVVDSSAMVMRTDVLRAVGGFDPVHMIHDIVFNYQFRLAAGHELVRTPRPLARIRLHPSQIHHDTDGSPAAVGMVAERMDAAAMLLASDRADDGDYRRWLAQRIRRLGRLRSQYTADALPAINLPASERLDLAVDDLLAVTGTDEIVAVIGPDLLYHHTADGGSPAGKRKLWPVPQTDGHYSGPPTDDETVMADLERARAEGATVAAVAWPSFWWLDFHHRLRDHLDRYRIVVDNSRIVIYRLDHG